MLAKQEANKSGIPSRPQKIKPPHSAFLNKNSVPSGFPKQLRSKYKQCRSQKYSNASLFALIEKAKELIELRQTARVVVENKIKSKVLNDDPNAPNNPF